MDLRGSFQNRDLDGYVNMSFNELTKVEIDGCFQIKALILQNNKLEPDAIDYILKQINDFGTSNGIIDLRQNKPPSATGLTYIANLEKRGWKISVDKIITGKLEHERYILYNQQYKPIQ